MLDKESLEIERDSFINKFANQSITPNFDNSGYAYDRCNWDESMMTGRIFTVESEQIVGIAWAWPVAVTQAHGKLHTTTLDPRQWGDDGFGEPKVAASVEAALNLAREKGWALADWAQPEHP